MLQQTITNTSKLNHRLRFEYLDSLRGIAALFVVFHHVFLQSEWRQLPHWMLIAVGGLYHGHFAVGLFIVLSGYCLMLPVVRTGELKGGWLGYIKRRAKRILPPYYAALLLCLMIDAAIPSLGMGDSLWSQVYPAFEYGAIISHLLLVHNLSSAWVFKINYPLWSVATEWQIYFLLPLVILPSYRRWGWLGALLVPAILLSPVYYLFHEQIRYGCPWYALLFAMGAMASTIEKAGLKYLFFSAGCFLLTLIVLNLHPIEWVRYAAWVPGLTASLDLVNGVGWACLLAWLGSNGHSLLGRILSVSPLVKLGGISYSLYLTHAFVLAAVYLMTSMMNWNQNATGFLIGIPTSLLVAWLFYLVFEQPFVAKR